MILVDLFRVMSGAESTLGVLYRTMDGRRRPLCFTLEDQFQREKIAGETRIPPGTYLLALRTEGGFHERYAERFGALHRGMLWLQDVPGFDLVLVHCGNTDQETRGCILVGEVADMWDRGSLARSEVAYRRVYPELAAWIIAGEDVRLRITDVDTPL